MAIFALSEKAKNVGALLYQSINEVVDAIDEVLGITTTGSEETQEEIKDDVNQADDEMVHFKHSPQVHTSATTSVKDKAKESKLLEQAKLMVLPTNTLSIERTFMNKKNHDKLMRSSHKSPLDITGATLEALKNDLFEGIREQTDLIRRSMIKNTNKLMIQIKLLQEVNILPHQICILTTTPPTPPLIRLNVEPPHPTPPHKQRDLRR
ncbi:hypothetical protein L6452_19469 [Arctium lappa]|uniref:Uncharacterized protein n=1 Tax=Arctium lappa TaxID=4217 RepID=A0ACB9B848_ARCLA|nr:hypothetical protein L6452_19469 [Arctium lappa]